LAGGGAPPLEAWRGEPPGWRARRAGEERWRSGWALRLAREELGERLLESRWRGEGVRGERSGAEESRCAARAAAVRAAAELRRWTDRRGEEPTRSMAARRGGRGCAWWWESQWEGKEGG